MVLGGGGGPKGVPSESVKSFQVGGGRTAQKRVTGGGWRRIVLGHVLAEQVRELRGRARVWP